MYIWYTYTHTYIVVGTPSKAPTVGKKVILSAHVSPHTPGEVSSQGLTQGQLHYHPVSDQGLVRT